MIDNREITKNKASFFLTIFIDEIILALIILFSLFILSLFYPLIPSDYQNIFISISICLTFCIWFIYFFVIFKKSGQTFGMKLLRLKMEPIEGEEIGYGITLAYSLFLMNPVTGVLFFIYIISCQDYRIVTENGIGIAH